MTTTIDRPVGPKRGETNAAPAVVPRPTPTVVLTAGFGAVMLIFSLVVWGRWVASDRFRPIAVGPDKIATFRLWLLYGLQAAGFALAAFFLWRYLYRPWRRGGRLTTDGVILLALPLAWFWDPFFNYSQNWLSYNAHLLNLGSWTGFVPGWVSPHQDRMSEPLVVGAGYIFWVFGAMLIGCWALKKLRNRWPAMSLLPFLGLALLCCCAIDLVLEWSSVLVGWYALPGGSFALLGGSRYQLPLLEVLFGGVQTLGWVSLRYFRDAQGYTLVERGVDRLNVTGRVRTTLRWLAFSGGLAAVALLFNIPVQWQGLHSGRWPKGLPSYLTTTCPAYKANPAACGGPGIPIPRAH
jgi:Spirocyclase AveC-like